MDLASAIQATAAGVRIAVRAQPRASRSAVLGAIDDGRGGVALKVAIAAPPVDGEANEALVALLAAALDVSKKRVRIATGESGRSKRVEVDGIDVVRAAERLRAAVR